MRRRTIRGVGRARVIVDNATIKMASGKRRPYVIVSSFWQAMEPGETNDAGAAAMTPEAAERLADTIRDAAKAARRKATSSQ